MHMNDATLVPHIADALSTTTVHPGQGPN